ncbi:hypothetical protein [Luteimonas aquatica]|uniref:hypothetical protein n=1 Tax=Luteimonas aquatica TaxID=450364 RepID=UPI001F5623F0|nr:hypothetical protein [Luteimonas aquatica]
MNRFLALPLAALTAAALYAVPSTSHATTAASFCSSVQKGRSDKPIYALWSTMTFSCVNVGTKTIAQLGAEGWKITHIIPAQTKIIGTGPGGFPITELSYQLIIQYNSKEL